jgi:peroxiredoxin Q/BCP
VNVAINRSKPSKMLNVGDAAPDFSLLGSDGRVHTLREHIGVRGVVLAWFPKAFTGG